MPISPPTHLRERRAKKAVVVTQHVSVAVEHADGVMRPRLALAATLGQTERVKSPKERALW